MFHRRNKDLHVVRDPEEQTDELVEQIITELNREDRQIEEIEEQVREHRKSVRRKTAIGVASVAAAAIVIFLVIYLQTYTEVRVSDTYVSAGSSDSNYRQFADGMLKYSRDGISYLNRKGEEQWNQSYQIKTPFVITGEESAAVADKGGNDIVVFQKSGVKGEIHTTLPIEKIALSEQGIVCAVLKDESAPKIICYDTAGNILVEHKTSINGTGYPVDVSLSPDGEVMQVVYLHMQSGKIISKIVYYNFGEAGEGKTDRQVTSKEYEDTVMAEGFFMGQKVSAAIGDDKLVIYKGGSVPDESVSIDIDKEIKSVFHSDKYIGLVLKNEGKGGYELRLYNSSGKQVLSKDFTGDYSNVKMCGSQVIMYDGKKCSIFMRSGIQKFQGEMETNILEIFPVAGVNKYIVMNANGMENVRLVK